MQGAHAEFNIERDAFSISNAPGWCFAMAAFSRWYYINHQGEPPLREALNAREQQRIAKELQDFYSKNLIKLQADYCNRYHGNQAIPFGRLVAGLMAGEPQLILLMNKGPRGAILHAVLAYEWIPEQKTLKIYDPNYSQEERFVSLEEGTYTSLDITYHAICFPDVLHYHRGLLTKMEALYTYGITRRAVASARGPVARPQVR